MQPSHCRLSFAPRIHSESLASSTAAIAMSIHRSSQNLTRSRAHLCNSLFVFHLRSLVFLTVFQTATDRKSTCHLLRHPS